MTRDNEKHKIDEPLDDFDGVSLYPSAIARCSIYKGKPQVLQQYD
jgi:hypothetical protein